MMFMFYYHIISISYQYQHSDLFHRNTSFPYSYKIPTILSDNVPILRFAMAIPKPGSSTTLIAGAWSKGINIHSFSLDHQETTKLYLEVNPEATESSQRYETVYLRVENHLLQTTVYILSPLRVLSMLQTPLEIQLRDDHRISSAVTPATTSVHRYIHHVLHPEDRKQQMLLYSAFPFPLVNHFDYYDRERPENKNSVYIRLRSKTTGIWGKWLRIPDVYYRQDYRLCRIHIPVDNENNYNYCYIVNRYYEDQQVNCIELLPAVMFINYTSEDLFFKQYINEGCIKAMTNDCSRSRSRSRSRKNNARDNNTARIDYNYLSNEGIHNTLIIKPYMNVSAVSSALPLSSCKDSQLVVIDE